MSLIEPDISFSLSRVAAHCLTPGKLPLWVAGIAAGYGIEAPVLAADFSGTRYFRANAQQGVSGLISTDWPGGGLALDADGRYRSFGTNELPALSGVGLDIWQRYDNLLSAGWDFSNAAWSSVSMDVLAGGVGPDGVTASTEIKATADSYKSLYQAVAATAAGTYTLSEIAKPASTVRSSLEYRGTGGGPDAVFNNSDGSIGSGTGYTAALSEGWYRDWIVKAAVDTSELCILGINGLGTVTGESVYIWQAQLVEGSIPGPVIGSSGVRYATTVTDPDFSSLAAACGLNSGFKIGARLSLDRLSDSTARCLWTAGEDADNCARLDITTTNRAKFTLRKSASDVLTLESGAFDATGDKDIAVTAQDGAWTLSATGVAGDSDAGLYGLPTLSRFRYGSQFGDTAYLNGTMKNLVLGPVA